MANGWLQVNAALERDAQPARHSAGLAFATLGPAIEAARHDEVDQFWFQRKPPDLRLRFASNDVDRTEAWAAPLLDALVRARVLASWHRAPYEPEWRKLGSGRAMDGYHRWADADTRAWVAFDRWIDAADIREPAVEAAVARMLIGPVLDDLFVDVIGDGHEVWDTWCNVLDLAGMGAVADPVEVPPHLAAATAGSMAGATAAMGVANEELADALRGAVAAGESDTGLRATTALIAQLALNRWGLDAPAQRELAGTYAAAHDPRARLRGVEPPR